MVGCTLWCIKGRWGLWGNHRGDRLGMYTVVWSLTPLGRLGNASRRSRPPICLVYVCVTAGQWLLWCDGPQNLHHGPSLGPSILLQS